MDDHESPDGSTEHHMASRWDGAARTRWRDAGAPTYMQASDLDSMPVGSAVTLHVGTRGLRFSFVKAGSGGWYLRQHAPFPAERLAQFRLTQRRPAVPVGRVGSPQGGPGDPGD